MPKWLPILLLSVCPLLAQKKYDGPRPPKTDLPYLQHADNLVPTERADAKQEEHKNEVTYVIAGANSSARTPLSSPSFLFQSEEISADHLQLFKLQSKGGQREVLFSRKKKQVAHPLRLNVTQLEGTLYKLEVDEILENGEYSLSPTDSNKVFCFQVY
jgi:hypothetical protein